MIALALILFVLFPPASVVLLGLGLVFGESMLWAVAGIVFAWVAVV